MARALVILICCSACWADCKLPDAAPPIDDRSVTVEALLEAGHFPRAKMLIASLPEEARSLWLLSRAEAGLGHQDAALKLAGQAVSLDGTKSEYHVQLAAANGRLAERASMFKQLGYAKRAKKELDIALELNPDNVDALYGLMLFYYAAPSFVGGDKQKALDAADRMTRLSPARGYLAQARLAAERKDAAAEESFYKKAIDADPLFYEAKATLAQFYLEREPANVDAAADLACEAVRLDPDRVDAWSVLAEVEVRNQCWDELFILLDRAKTFVPGDGRYYYSAGDALARLGMSSRWAEQFLRAYLSGPVESDQFLARAHLRLGEVLQGTNRDEAKVEFAKAIELDPALAKR